MIEHGDKKKLLIITPHLSTGGAPQVTVNKIELIKDEFDIKVVEYTFSAWNYVVQRNKIIDMVGVTNFISLGDQKHDNLKAVLDSWNPDVISTEEFPEMFMTAECASLIYKGDRTWTILESTHDSSFDTRHKKLIPDKFIFVSPYTLFKYAHLDVPSEIIEYPVDVKQRNKQAVQEKLGLDPTYKHVVIVGLFSARKNQGYAFEIARRMDDKKIKFHFLGNQAGNFISYWEPIMKNKPDNCVIWGERSDVQDFVQASDVFLFPSRGDRHNKELNPIAIKEAMEYNDVLKFMYNLDVYCGKYDGREDVFYLSGDVDIDALSMSTALNFSQLDEELVVIGTYPNTDKRVKLTKECIQSLKLTGRKILLVSHYAVDQEIQKMVDYYIYDAHNPMTHHSFYTKFFNYKSDYDVDLNINELHNSNQSLAVLTNMFNGFKHAKQHGFKRLFYITFDVVIDPRDIDVINESFNTVSTSKKAYMAIFHTRFNYGVQTNGITFDVDYFLQNFDDVRDVENYNRICNEIGAENFLEDYLAKKIDCLDKNEMYIRPMKADKGDETFLEHSGTGVSSHSEYYSILPIKDSPGKYMFYFYTYNVDDRKIHIRVGDAFFIIEIAKTREFKHEFEFNGQPIEITMDFYDGDRVYKKDKYEMTNANIEKYNNTGSFTKKNIKPKIKLVHIQTTRNDEREQLSRKSLERVKDFGWEYVIHTNEPYASLPPVHTCLRPACVSMELFDDEKANKLGTALTPAHYGCFEAFKNAILSEFNDCDFLMVCEGDCILEVTPSEFVKKVEMSCQTITNENIGYMSYGDKALLEQGWVQSPVVKDINNLMYITDKIIGLQCIMFPKKIAYYLKEQLRTHDWDATDYFFNIIMRNSSMNMGIVHNRLTTQADGFSLIDKTNKTFIKK